MKKLCFTTATCFALFLPSITNAAPSCTGTCRNYIWNTAHAAFICAGASCQCTATTTQPCWNPCNDNLWCNTTQWSEVPNETGIQIGTVYLCSLDTSTGICDVTTRTTQRCAIGYFDASQGASGSCTSCAEATGNSHATSPAASFAITSCYVPANIEFEFSDASGSGTAYFESDCSYTQ